MLLKHHTKADTTLSQGSSFKSSPKRHSNLPLPSSHSLARYSSRHGNRFNQHHRIFWKVQQGSDLQLVPLPDYDSNSSTEAVLEAIANIDIQLQCQVTVIAKRLDEIGKHLDMIRTSLDFLEGRMDEEQVGKRARLADA